MGEPLSIIQVMDDHDLVLKPLYNLCKLLHPITRDWVAYLGYLQVLNIFRHRTIGVTPKLPGQKYHGYISGICLRGARTTTNHQIFPIDSPVVVDLPHGKMAAQKKTTNRLNPNGSDRTKSTPKSYQWPFRHRKKRGTYHTCLAHFLSTM